MSTVGKAALLLDVLGTAGPDVALAEAARITGFDKATARRLLVSLIEHGLVEQDEATRTYRLGAGIARLAALREERFPFLRAAAPVAERLAARTGETVHLSEHCRRGLMSVHVVESARANRVSVPIGELLPLHATASGVAFLAFAAPRLREAALAAPLERYTAHTIADPARLSRYVEATRERGYSLGSQGFEDGVESVAAAILNGAGFAVGAIAVAAPRARVQPGDLERFGAWTLGAAQEIGARLYGTATARQPAHGREEMVT
jgi:DNA-binding IclR family transcriptional regulator